MPLPSAQLVGEPSRYEGCGGNLGVRMLQILTRLGTYVLEEGDAAESQILLQIGDPHGVGPESLGSLIIDELRQRQAMVGIFDNHLVRTNVAHLVVDALRPASGVSFNLVDGMAVRDHSHLPIRLAVGVHVKVGRAQELVARAERKHPARCPTGFGRLLYYPTLCNRVSSQLHNALVPEGMCKPDSIRKRKTH